MKRRKIRVIRELREILGSTEFNEFTMVDLRDVYQSRFGLGVCPSSSELRKWLYRRVTPLVKKGLLTKSQKGNSHRAIYCVTEKFRREHLLSQTPIQPINQPKLETETQNAFQIKALKSKLNQYQVDMLACAGECKEYRQLAIDYPHLRKQIDPMYRSARELSSELMGQIRAINNILKQAGAE